MRWKKAFKNFTDDDLEKLVLDYDFLRREGYLHNFSLLWRISKQAQEEYGEVNFSLLASEIYYEASRELIRRAYKI
jgi:hypothetical protein